MSAAVCPVSACASRSKYALRHVVQLHGEIVPLEARERVGQMVDRVVLDGPRAVTALVPHLEREVVIDLLGRLHVMHERLAVLEEPAATFVERVAPRR